MRTVPPYSLADPHADQMNRELYGRTAAVEHVLGIDGGEDLGPDTPTIQFALVQGIPIKFVTGFCHQDEGWNHPDDSHYPIRRAPALLNGPDYQSPLLIHSIDVLTIRPCYEVGSLGQKLFVQFVARSETHITGGSGFLGENQPLLMHFNAGMIYNPEIPMREFPNNIPVIPTGLEEESVYINRRYSTGGPFRIGFRSRFSLTFGGQQHPYPDPPAGQELGQVRVTMTYSDALPYDATIPLGNLGTTNLYNPRVLGSPE